MKKKGNFLKRVTLNKMAKSSFLLVGRELVGPTNDFQKEVMLCAEMLGSTVMDTEMYSGKDKTLRRWKPGPLGMMIHTGLHPESSANPWRVCSRGII